MLDLNLVWVFWEPVPVFEGACITRPAFHVFRLFLLLLRPDISPLPKALLPPGPLVLLLRTIPKSAQPLLFTLVEKSCLNAAVCYCTSAHLIIWTTSSSRNSSTGKVKPGMWIIGHLSAGRYSSSGLSRVIFLSPRLLTFVALPTKILGEFLRVERGAHEDDFEVIPEAEQVLDNDEQHIRLQIPLVDFVQHEVTNAGQQPVLHANIRKA